MNLADLFPKAQNKPIPVCAAIDEAAAKYIPPPPLTKRYLPLVPRIKQGQNAHDVEPGAGFQSCVRIRSDKPAPTLPKIIGGIGYGTLIHPVDDRALSIGECRRLGSFPDGFRFSGKYVTARAHIGNSVPPLMMRAIAGALARKLFERESLKDLNVEDFETYKDLLNAAWAEHLAPREPDAPAVVSLFAGCGGSSLGYSMAGYRELLAVDFDRKCAGTFRLNFSGVPFLVADLRGLSAEELMEAAGLSGPGELDLLDGSPPCQGFSTAGKRDFFDPRNQLYNEFARLLEGTRPKAFVMENVSGMVKGKMKLAFADCTRALKAAGYRVSCRLMDAKWFNVPQERKRLIWIGLREDLGIEPGHPKAKMRSISTKSGLMSANVNCLPAPPVTGKIRQIMLKLKAGQSASALPELKGSWHGNFKIPADKPCLTITKEAAFWKRYPKVFHYLENRGLSVGEVKRLFSYPDEFQVNGKWAEAWGQVGNSVPPLFMRAIAIHIRSLLI